MTKEVMREALTRIAEGNLGDAPWQANYTAIKRIATEALAQPEQESFSPEAIRATQAAWKMGYDAAKAEQEPHSWYSKQVDEWMTNKTRKEHERLNSYTHKFGKFDLALYTAPPQRKPLTDEEIEEKNT